MFKRYIYIEGLTNLLGSNKKFYINNDGQVKDIKGNDIPYWRDNDGNKVVHCLGWDGERDYRVIDLVAIQFKSLKIPVEDYNNVIAFTIDGDPDNTHAKNIGYRFKNGKLTFKPRPGFYYIPGFTGLAINEKGEVVDTLRNIAKTFRVSSPGSYKNITGGYYITNVVFTKNKYVSASRHRLLCLVFKEYPDNVDYLVVNHINGIPGDDRLDNLEWNTRSENNQHAWLSDLRSQNKKVLVRNVFTGEVTEYYSICECARRLGYSSDETIRQRLISSPFGKVFQDATQIKFKDDKRSWVIPDDPEASVKQAQPVIPVLVRNCKDLSITEFKSVTDAGKYTGVERSTIELRLKTGNRKPLFGWQFKLKSDNKEWQEFTEKEYLDSLKPNNFPVDARNLLTGKTLKFSSVNQAEKYFGKTFSWVITRGKQPLYPDGWQLKYEIDEWNEVLDIEETL